MEREYLFIQGNVPIDSKYFINKIEEGIKEKSNLNYKTNLSAKMTSYEYFSNNKNFLKVMLPIFDLVDEHTFKSNPGWNMNEAWGFKQSFGDYSKPHDHIPHKVFLSGAMMLTNHSQSLYFPERQVTSLFFLAF